MAKITTITNPLTGQPAQVDQLDHTAQQIDDLLDIARNAYNYNFLRNWYFAKAVNQRGISVSTANTYGIDGWITYGGTHTVSDGYIEIPQNGVMSQLLENYSELNGMEMTASVLTADGTLYTGTAVVDLSASTIFQSVTGFMLYLTSAGIFQFYSSAASLKAVAAKLETGNKQTLAHQDANGKWVVNEIPIYGEELLKCQRYLQLYSAADKRPDKAVDCRPVMRDDPVQGTIVVNSTTYYYNFADL